MRARHRQPAGHRKRTCNKDRLPPDYGFPRAADPNRLHWTDEVRHQGDLAYKRYVRGQGASDFGYGLLADLGGGNDTYDVMGSQAANNANWKQAARVANSGMDPFDPMLDHGYGFDGEAAWPGW